MKLYDHQEKIVTEDKPVAGLWLGTGSGKTRIALSLARGKTLVICPKTQKEDGNWERELRKILPDDEEQEKWETLETISKETFRRDYEKLPRFDTVIVDEADTCLGVTPNVRWVKKQPIPKTSQLFEALGLFIMRTKPSRVYLATATIMRSPMTVWGAAKILGQSWDFYKFRDTFYIRLPIPEREIWQAKKDTVSKLRLAEAVKKLGYVGRLEDYFDVPEQTYKTIWVDLTPKQKARIKQLALEYPEPIVRVGKINQVENGVLKEDEFNEAEEFENAKMDKILDLATEFPRMVLFVKFSAQIAKIEATLRKEGYKVITLTGATKDRGAALKEAAEAKACIFIAQAQISAGWELKEYPCMVFVSRTYSLGDYTQGVGRIQRSDNIKKNLYISLVVKGGVDEAIHDCVENKRDFDEALYAKKI